MLLSKRRSQMSMNTLLAVVAITIPFIVFAGVLLWAERQTRTTGGTR